MDNKKKLGKRIKELRKNAGLTQEQVAEQIEMEQNTISVIESGRNFPTLMTLEKIAKVLNVELSDFFDYEYLADIDSIRYYVQNKFQQFNETKLRQLFKYMKTL